MRKINNLTVQFSTRIFGKIWRRKNTDYSCLKEKNNLTFFVQKKIWLEEKITLPKNLNGRPLILEKSSAFNFTLRYTASAQMLRWWKLSISIGAAKLSSFQYNKQVISMKIWHGRTTSNDTISSPSRFKLSTKYNLYLAF